MTIRAYKFYSARWGLDALYRRRLKVSTGRDINDPFEFLAAGSDKTSRRDAKEIRQKMFSDKGIISFCQVWKDPVLWGHYADNHRGVALGFDLKEKIGFQVKYTKERIRNPEHGPRPAVFGERANFSNDILITKFDSWSYEREVRVFPSLSNSIYENGLYFREFDDVGQLKEIIIGVNYKSEGNPVLAKEMLGLGVEIYTARLAFNDYSLVRQERKKLQKEL